MKHAWILIGFLPFLGAAAAEEPTEAEARAALRKAVAFFCEEVSTEGGYLWRYSADLKLREGEGQAKATTIWVQPPGTPEVGMALLEAYERSGEESCLDGAVAAARALVRGQLKSGCWTMRIDFDPDDRAKQQYRTELKHSRKARNVSALDDNASQAALRLMMRVDRALGFKDETIHEATLYGLKSLLAAQFDSGGFPQAFVGPVDKAGNPAKKATFPDEWPKAYPGHQNYWYKPTMNDNLLADVIATLFEASEIYKDETYRDAALKGGEFILLAQLPEPQPGWAQQYSFDMQPIWARKFEPVSVTGGESKGVIYTLMDLYRRTGDKKWLKPIPRALAYYKRSRLPDGRLARFYELKTNKPLFFTKDYQVTYDDSDLPTHYGFIQDDWTEKAEAKLRKLIAKPWAPPEPAKPSRTKASTAARLIAALDQRGAWVEEGHMKYHKIDTRVIECRTFSTNIRALAGYLYKGDSR